MRLWILNDGQDFNKQEGSKRLLEIGKVQVKKLDGNGEMYSEAHEEGRVAGIRPSQGDVVPVH